MISQRTIDLNNFVTIDSTGLNVASFIEIKAALIDKYKSIYGSDIDLSTGNADGEYVNELALMLNNLLQSIKTLYGNLDVNTASGVYLDALCALSNVYRKQASRSKATIQLTNTSSSTISLLQSELNFSDQSGMHWEVFSNYQDGLVIESQHSKVIDVECSQLGPVEAPSGWINTMVGYPEIEVTQSNKAIVGQNIESDESLRSRRNQFISPVGMTVLESLSAALLNIQSVKDVKIYNNQSDAATVQSSDGTSTVAHGIYVIIRQTSNDIDIDSVIGDTIYNKLTPGIRTTESNTTIDKSATHIPTMLGLTVNMFEDTVYWKLAEPIHPNIVVTITELPNTGYAENTLQLISDALIDYLNNLPIGNIPDENNIIMETLMADPRQKGMPTFNVSSVNLGSAATNPDTYYNYTTFTPSGSGTTHVITIS